MRYLIALVLIGSSGLALSEPDSTLTHLDELYRLRDTPDIAKELETTFDSMVRRGDNYDILWRAARFKWWLADGSSGDRRKELGRAAWNLGERAYRKNPKGIEGKYYSASGIGAYSQAIGVVNALREGLENKFNERLDAAIDQNPDLDSGGPLIAKGRYYYELPWPKRDLSKSQQLYNRVVAKFPQNLRAYLWLAETELRDGNPRKAQATLQKVLNGDISYDPPEGRRVQNWAQWVKKQIEEKVK